MLMCSPVRDPDTVPKMVRWLEENCITRRGIKYSFVTFSSNFGRSRISSSKDAGKITFRRVLKDFVCLESLTTRREQTQMAFAQLSEICLDFMLS